MKKRALLLAAVSLAGVFNAACTPPPPNAAELAEHAAAVSVMLNSSIARCSPHDAPPAYYVRLERALQPLKTETLTTLHKHNVAVCLDARLEQQSVQEGHQKISVVYYGADRVAAVTDNGQHDPNASSYGWQVNPAFMVRGPLGDLAERLDAGEINAAQNYYSRSWSKSGKSGSGGSVMESEAEASQAVKTHIARNAWIRNAPETSPGNQMTLPLQAAPTTHISVNASAKFTL